MLTRLLAVVALTVVLGFVAFAVLLPQPAARGLRTDAVVVLTGGPGRLERGLAVLQRGEARRMLVSGVDRTVRPHELAIRARVPNAVFACCVDLGQEAIDTRSNAEETAAWLRRRGYRSVRLVTTDWHMWRACFELKRALAADGGPPVSIEADAVRSKPRFDTLLTEYAKYVLRRLSDPLGI